MSIVNFIALIDVILFAALSELPLFTIYIYIYEKLYVILGSVLVDILKFSSMMGIAIII